MNHTWEEYRQSLMEILRNVNRRKLDIAADVYEWILQQDNQVEALRFFLEEAEDAGLVQEEQENLQDEELEELSIKCDKLIDGIITSLIAQKPDIEIFYDTLWNLVRNIPLINTREERVYTLYRIWMNDWLPYFQLEAGIRMENEKFGEISQACKMKIKKAFFILSVPLQQRTETASLIMQILDSCETEEEKAVILAQILAYVERRILINFRSYSE